VSPVFRHGRLRLYLLKLLDEAPRHGYEVIRLLQDRFLGVYAPSPGTIYPRLARLEEEGLVTHDEADGRKVYRITDRGREELHARLDDLAELEAEITASVRDIAREVSEDVRETVRNLREELASAARDMQGRSHQHDAGHPRGATAQARRAAGRGGETSGTGESPEAGEAGEEPGRPGGRRARARRGWGDWGDWTGWSGGAGWGDWTGKGGPHGQASHRAYRDLERMARQFAGELRMAAWQAQTVSEEALGDLRHILDETLDRIHTEVFGTRPGQHRPGESTTGPAADSPAADSPAADSPAAESPAADSPAAESPAAEDGPEVSSGQPGA